MPSHLHLASISDPGAHPQRGLPDLILEVSTPSTHSLNCLYLLSLIFFIATLFSSLPDPDGLSAYVPSNVSINLRHFRLTYRNIPAQFISSKVRVDNCAKDDENLGSGTVASYKRTEQWAVRHTVRTFAVTATPPSDEEKTPRTPPTASQPQIVCLL